MINESTDNAAIKSLAIVARINKSNFVTKDVFLKLIPVQTTMAQSLHSEIVSLFTEHGSGICCRWSFCDDG